MPRGSGFDSFIVNKSGAGIASGLGKGVDNFILGKRGYATVVERTDYYSTIMADAPVFYMPLDEPPGYQNDHGTGHPAEISGKQSGSISSFYFNNPGVGANPLVHKRGPQQMFWNPSFEASTNGWYAENSTLTRDTAEYHSGVASCRVDVVSQTAGTAGIRSAWWEGGNIAATQGQRITASMWIKGTAGQLVWPYFLEQNVGFGVVGGGTGVRNSIEGIAHGDNHVLLTGAWQQITFDFIIANADCTNLDLYIKNVSTTQTWWMDEIYVYTWDQAYAVDFDGIDDYIAMQNYPAASPTAAISVEAWVRPDSLPTSTTYKTIVSKNASIWLRLDNSPSYFAFYWYDGTAWQSVFPNFSITTPGSVYHVVGTYDGTTGRLYVNGVDVSSPPNAHSGTVNATTDGITISLPDTSAWDGVIDEVAVYDYPLSAAQILNHYNVGQIGTQGTKQMVYQETGPKPANFFPNGDVETDLSYWGAWYGTVVRSNAQAKFGSWSVYFAGAGHLHGVTMMNPSGNPGSTISLADLLPVLPNTTYIWSCWVRADVGGNYYIQFCETDSTGTNTINTINSATLAPGVWTRLDIRVVTAANTRYAWALAVNASGATDNFYVDGAKLEIGAVNPNIFPNPDVETDLSNWLTYNPITLTRSNSVMHSGGWSARVVPSQQYSGPRFGGTTDNYGATPSTDYLACSPNTLYTLSCWVRSDSTADYQLYIREFDSSGAYVTQSGSPTKSCPSNIWTLISWTIRTSSSTAYLDGVLFAASTTFPSFYADDVYIGLTPVATNFIAPITGNGSGFDNFILNKTGAGVAGGIGSGVSSFPVVRKSGYAIASGVGTGVGRTASTPVLLLHADGIDGSTSFPDVYGHTVTAVGNAQVDTAQLKFGSASALFDGSGDYLSIPDSADWAFGSGDFTIDFWVRFNSVVATTFIAQRSSTDTDRALLIGGSATAFTLGISAGGASWDFLYQPAWTPSANTWYHIAVVRTGNTIKIFINGTQIGSNQTFSGTQRDSAQALTIGGDLVSAADSLNGWIDEIRIIKGYAAWTSNFTAPTVPYGWVPSVKTGYAVAVTVGAGPSASLYTKTGYASAGGVSSGVKASTYAKTGYSTTGGIGSGPSVSVFAKSGYSTLSGIGSGPSVSVYTKTGFSTVGSIGAGADQDIYSETGFSTAGGVGTGASASVYTKSGFAVTRGISSGSSVNIYVETGFSTVGSIASGSESQATLIVKTGFAATNIICSGILDSVLNKTGCAIAGIAGAGPSASFTAKTGYSSAGGIATGASASIFVESGKALAGEIGAGFDADIDTETGFAVIGSVGRGTNVFTSGGGTIWSKAGFAFIGNVSSGISVAIFVKSGRVISDRVVSGEKLRLRLKTGIVISKPVTIGHENKSTGKTGRVISDYILGGAYVFISHSHAGHVKSTGRLFGISTETYNRAGNAFSDGVLRGKSVVTFTESGVVVSSFSAGAVKQRFITKSGFANWRGLASGFERTQFTESGKVTGSWSSQGLRQRTRPRAGFISSALAAIGLASGIHPKTGKVVIQGIQISGVKLRVVPRAGHVIVTVESSASRNRRAIRTGTVKMTPLAGGDFVIDFSDNPNYFERTLLEVIVEAPELISAEGVPEPTLTAAIAAPKLTSAQR